jgi:threonyl-tRNA synthetase
MKDHREIGRDMDLFMFSDLSPGSPIWLPNGNIVYTILQEKIRALQRRFHYIEVRTPILWKSDLYEQSGHMEHYAGNMFLFNNDAVINHHVGCQYALKPMNCPGHMEIYRSKGARPLSELPLRIAEQGVLHRNEPSGSLSGLTRCRAFCQDDAHIFLAPEQLDKEITMLVSMIQRVYGRLRMEIRAVLSTRPASWLGEIETWDKAENALRAALTNASHAYSEAPGEGAFYGPKIDFYVKDSLGREWQTATVQLDFQLPRRFNLEYVDRGNMRKTPVVVHRAIYGSFERFIAILLEHYQGHLPVWLAPIQYAILPVTDRALPYCHQIREKLEHDQLRSVIDTSGRRLVQMVASAQAQYIPKMLVLGDREMTDGLVTVRDRDGKNNMLLKQDFFADATSLNEFDFGFPPDAT